MLLMKTEYEVVIKRNLGGLLVGALFLLVDCASTEDYSMTPAEAYSCAAEIMGVTPPGPVPPVEYRYGYWEALLKEGLTLVRGTYNKRSGVVTVTIERESYKTLVHEMVHALLHQLGKPQSEDIADDAETLISSYCLRGTHGI